MVYTGKPSTGCQRCKQRRKKCDEAKPFCNNCKRLGRECPGYPDQTDLLFKNETGSTERRAAAVGESSSRRGRRRGNSSSPRSPASPLRPAWPADAGNISNALTNQYLYMAGPTTSATSSQFDRAMISGNAPFGTWSSGPTTELWSAGRHETHHGPSASKDKQAADPHDRANPSFEQGRFLLAPIRWIALQTMSFVAGREEWKADADAMLDPMMQATWIATQGLKISNVTDEVLLPILLLSLYEIFAVSEGIQNGIRVHSVVRTQPLQELIRRRSGIGLEEMRDSGRAQDEGSIDATTEGTVTPIRCLVEQAIRLPTLLEEADRIPEHRPRSPDLIADVEEIIQAVYQLQRDFDTWERRMPPQYGHRAVELPQAEDPRERGDNDVDFVETYTLDQVHVYQNASISGIRNLNRVCQLLCSRIVVKALKWLAPLTYDMDPRYKACVFRIQYNVDDICASVPMSREGRDSSQTDQGLSMVIRDWQEASYLVWPLHVASQMPQTPESQQIWLKRRLAEIIEAWASSESIASSSVQQPSQS